MGGSINHSQSFIFSGSYHFTTIGEWVGAGSFAWGRVTVEKLSGQTKCMAVSTCTCGMFFFFSLLRGQNKCSHIDFSVYLGNLCTALVTFPPGFPVFSKLVV